jgi:hypothetical protein
MSSRSALAASSRATSASAAESRVELVMMGKA